MKSPEYLTEHYELYLYNGESYFFTWENWSLYGSFTFFYNGVLEEIIAQNEFKKDTLYNVSLFVDRNSDDPEDWYEYEFKITKISHKHSHLEVEQVAAEVRAFNCQDSDLLADKLDELRQLLRPHK